MFRQRFLHDRCISKCWVSQFSDLLSLRCFLAQLILIAWLLFRTEMRRGDRSVYANAGQCDTQLTTHISINQSIAFIPFMPWQIKHMRLTETRASTSRTDSSISHYRPDRAKQTNRSFPSLKQSTSHNLPCDSFLPFFLSSHASCSSRRLLACHRQVLHACMHLTLHNR